MLRQPQEEEQQQKDEYGFFYIIALLNFWTFWLSYCT